MRSTRLLQPVKPELMIHIIFVPKQFSIALTNTNTTGIISISGVCNLIIIELCIYRNWLEIGIYDFQVREIDQA